jgi:hypothetical protein
MHDVAVNASDSDAAGSSTAHIDDIAIALTDWLRVAGRH